MWNDRPTRDPALPAPSRHLSAFPGSTPPGRCQPALAYSGCAHQAFAAAFLLSYARYGPANSSCPFLVHQSVNSKINLPIRTGVRRPGVLIPGHRPPLCSTTRNLPLTWGRLIATTNHMTNHYSFRLLAIGTMLMVALTAPAQQTATRPGVTDKDEHGQSAAQDDVPIVTPGRVA